VHSARDLDLGHNPAEDNAFKLPRSECIQELFPHSLASGPKFEMFLVVEDGALVEPVTFHPGSRRRERA
jgi:hypothetical protein